MSRLGEKITIVLLAIIAVLSAFIIFKVYDLEKTTRDLDLKMAYVEDNMASISDNVSSTIRDLLEEKNTIINEFTYDIEDIEGEKVLLKLRLLPKRYAPENKYYFSILSKDGTSKLIEAQANPGNYLVASLELPLKEDLELNYIEETEDGKNIEKLEGIYDLEEELLAPFISANSGFIQLFPDNDHFLLDDTFEISYDFNRSYYKEDKGIEGGHIYLALDGDILDSFPMKKGKRRQTDDLGYDFSDNEEVYKYTFKDYAGKLKDDDSEIEIYAIAKHSKGFKVKLPLGKISNSSDDDIQSDEDPYAYESQFKNSIILED